MAERQRTARDLAPLWRQEMGRCKHFNGLMHDRCKAGVAYDDVRDVSQRPCRFPCLTSDCYGEPTPAATTCAFADHPTEAEAREWEAMVREHSRRQWADIQANICPTHKQPITKRQVGRCVYAEPCGCRLYQGTLTKR